MFDKAGITEVAKPANKVFPRIEIPFTENRTL